MAQVAILIPAMRPHKIPQVVQSVVESTEDYRVIVIAAGECAEVARTLPVTLLEDNGGTWAERINAGFALSTEPVFLTGADDLLFHPGWFQAAMRTMEAVDGVVAVNDLYNPNGVHFLISRNYINTIGGVLDQPLGTVCCEEYAHSFVDDEIRATAKFHGRWAVSHDAVVEHLHCGAHKSEHDAVYAMGEASMPQGLQTFLSRKHLWEQ